MAFFCRRLWAPIGCRMSGEKLHGITLASLCKGNVESTAPERNSSAGSKTIYFMSVGCRMCIGTSASSCTAYGSGDISRHRPVLCAQMRESALLTWSTIYCSSHLRYADARSSVWEALFGSAFALVHLHKADLKRVLSPLCFARSIIWDRAMSDGTDIVEYFVHGVLGVRCTTATAGD